MQPLVHAWQRIWYAAGLRAYKLGDLLLTRLIVTHADLPALLLPAATRRLSAHIALGTCALAPGTAASRQQQQADSAVGTWAYLAPEVKAEGRSPAACSDAYALGLSLLQLVMCREPRDIIKACQQALEDCRLQQVA